MNVLVVNAGSSSLKYQLMNSKTHAVLAKGLCERIGIDGHIKHAPTGKPYYEAYTNMPTHAEAIQAALELLVDPEYGVINSISEIGAVGHRVLHGGDKFTAPSLVTDEVMKAIHDCIHLGPLHNPNNIIGILACQQVMPGVPMVAVFDTAFHQTMPPKAFTYALPYKFYDEDKVRRYGFHGSSYIYVSERAAELLGRPGGEGLKLVCCHLGNGSSIAAVKDGKSVDTSMGLTPLEGLPMGTRSGSVDPGVMEYLMYRRKLDIHEILDIMNKESGVLGISGISSDFRDLEAAADEGSERAKLAIDCFAYQVKKYIGSYAAAMGGVDAVVLTGGIGENSLAVRAAALSGLEFLGIKLDPEKMKVRGQELDISAPDATVRTLVIPTNEELVIATATTKIVEELNGIQS